MLRANSRTATALATSRDNEERGAKQSAAAAKASERKTRELLYAADMALAGAAWHKNEPARYERFSTVTAQPKTRADGSTEEDLRGFEWYFLDRQTRAPSELTVPKQGALYLIEFMPDGEEFLTAGKDSIVRWHDASTGKSLRSLDTTTREVNCVSYNPSRTLFATAGDDGTVKIWNAADLSLVHSTKVLDDKCLWANFLNDEKVVAGGWSESLQLINAATGQVLREYAAPEATLAKVEAPRSWNAYISKTGDQFWTTANSTDEKYRGIYKWNFENGDVQKLSADQGLCNVLLDSSEKYLFANTEAEVRILDAKTSDEIWSHRHKNQLEAIILSPDERQLIVSDHSGQILIWDLDLNNPSTPIPLHVRRRMSLIRAPSIQWRSHLITDRW